MADSALITRRTLAATLAAVPAAAVAGPVTVPEHSDAELLEIGRQWEEAVAASTAASDDPDMDEEEQRPIWDREQDLQVAIVKRPAKTMEGIRLKAKVGLHAASGYIVAPAPDMTLLEQVMVADGDVSETAALLALALDLLAMQSETA